ncbi:hypothetical protein EYF80_042304 [Liparis tanakae]|uniref:Uncharacterized protein n=1 Tax=Liparis tanakae TaxID=230148 RepID=A0A4Z2G4I5_9TELE|nr:hypothetical protein EYF80_042304 [Liparis tanakae]
MKGRELSVLQRQQRSTFRIRVLDVSTILPPRLLAVFDGALHSGATSGSIWSSHKEDRQPREDTSGFLMHHHSRDRGGHRQGRGCIALLNTAMRSRTTNSITFLFSRQQTQQQHRIMQHWLKRQQGICTLMSPTRLILALKMGNVGSYSFIFQPSISTSGPEGQIKERSCSTEASLVHQ